MRFFISIVGLFMWQSAFAANTPALFKADSYKKIVVENDRPFIMVLWSLDCPPCIKELTMLGKLNKQISGLDLVLVSTDSLSRKNDINKLLNDSGLSEFNSWVFAGDSEQKLRYTIDSSWYGELPRSYFHNNNQGRRSSVSGLLEKDLIISWLKINAIENNDQ